MPAIIVLAGVGFLAVAAVVILTVLVIGIHKGDRRHLINAPAVDFGRIRAPLLVGSLSRYPRIRRRRRRGAEQMSRASRNPRHHVRRPPLQRIRVPEVHCPRPVGPPQEVAVPEKPDPPRYRKEVMR